MKYKIGDRVVLKGKSPEFGTVVGEVSKTSHPFMRVLEDYGDTRSWSINYTIPFEIWNSPLYKLMQED